MQKIRNLGTRLEDGSMSYHGVQEYMSDTPPARITQKSVMHGKSKTFLELQTTLLPGFLTDLLFLDVYCGVLTRTEPTFCQVAP